MPKRIMADMKSGSSDSGKRETTGRISDVQAGRKYGDIKQITRSGISPIKERTLPPAVPRPVPRPPVPPERNREPITYYKSGEYKKRHSGLWLVAIISIIIFIFALSFLFTRASITVSPKVKSYDLNTNLSAIKDVNPDGLAFDLVIISGDVTRKVQGGETRDLALFSKGKIFIYNKQDTGPTALPAGTRLEGSNGKIYKTVGAVTIPAMVDENPGKVEVEIQGLEAGAEYDSGPLDFKVVSFKGTSKENLVYGRSNGDITGGFKGSAPTVTEEEKQAVFGELKNELGVKLLQKARDQIPAGFILYDGAAFLSNTTETVELANSGDSQVPVKVVGTLYGFLLNEAELTTRIANDNIGEYDGSEVYIPNIRELKFTLSDNNVSYSEVQNINFTLVGSAKVVWKVDEEELRGAFLGKSKKEFNSILSDFTNVDSAELSLSPFWVRSFPSKSKNIKIIVNYPE